jgi:type IV pilus assembly protein PilO
VSEFLDNLMERPRLHKVMGVVVIIALIVVVFWQFFYIGPFEEVGELRTKVDNLNAQLLTEKRIVRDLPRLREVVKELDVQLTKALNELPDKREIPSLLASISNLAKDAGLEVSLFKPKPEVLKDFYAEVPVSIIVDGNYHQVATFFDEVGQLARIVNMGEISMKDPRVSEREKRSTIKTSCTATTFRYLDESERQRVAEEKNKDSSSAVKRSR